MSNLSSWRDFGKPGTSNTQPNDPHSDSEAPQPVVGPHWKVRAMSKAPMLSSRFASAPGSVESPRVTDTIVSQPNVSTASIPFGDAADSSTLGTKETSAAAEAPIKQSLPFAILNTAVRTNKPSGGESDAPHTSSEQSSSAGPVNKTVIEIASSGESEPAQASDDRQLPADSSNGKPSSDMPWQAPQEAIKSTNQAPESALPANSESTPADPQIKPRARTIQNKSLTTEATFPPVSPDRILMTDPNVAPCPRPKCTGCGERVFALPPWIQCGSIVMGSFPLKTCRVCRDKNVLKQKGLEVVLKTIVAFKSLADTYFAQYNAAIDETDYQTYVMLIKEHAKSMGLARHQVKQKAPQIGTSAGVSTRRASRTVEQDDVVSRDDTGDAVAFESGAQTFGLRRSGRARQSTAAAMDTPSALSHKRAQARVGLEASMPSTPSGVDLNMPAFEGMVRRLENNKASAGDAEEADLNEYLKAVVEGNAAAYSLHLTVKKHPEKTASQGKDDADVASKLAAIEAAWSQLSQLFPEGALAEGLPHREMVQKATAKKHSREVANAILHVKQFVDQVHKAVEANADKPVTVQPE